MRLLKLLLILCVCAGWPCSRGAARGCDRCFPQRRLRDSNPPVASACGPGQRRRPVQPRRHVRSRPWRAAGLRGGGVVVSQGCRPGRCRAQYNLGVMYDTGQGVPQDYAAAVSWYRKAAEQELAMPSTTSASCTTTAVACRRTMQRRCRGIARPPSRAMPKPSTTSASCTTAGQGVPQDYAAAVSWYRKAAEQGDAGGPVQPRRHVRATARACRRTTRRRCRGIARLPTRPCRGPVQPRRHVRRRPRRAAGLRAGAHVVQPRESRYDASDKESRDSAVRNRDIVAAKMTPAQIAEAQKLAREWKPKPDGSRQ